MTSTRHIFAPTLLGVALVMGGCTTPPVKYFRGTAEVPTTQANASLPGALVYLQAARSQYQDAVETQMKSERDLGNTLVGAGALVVALAVGGANANIVAGTTLAAGTAYGFGNLNLPRQRVLIYMAGVEALSCVQKAVAPIYVTADDLTNINASITALQTSRNSLAGKLNEGQVLPKLSGSRLDEAVKVGTDVLRIADATLNSARDLLQTSRSAARDVVAAVNGIDEAVVKSIVNSTPELSAVPGIVAGLAGMSSLFATGAGVDPLAAKLGALSKRADAVKTGPVAKSPEDVKADQIIEAANQAIAANAALAQMLPKPVQWPAEAFKSCGVAEVVSALSVSVAPLEFTAGVDARQTFDIFGGVKPYFVRLQGAPIDGISAASPIRFDNQAEVSVTGSKVKSDTKATIRVIDSSPTARSLNVDVVVKAPALPASSAQTMTQQSAPDTPSAPTDDDLAKLKQKGIFTLDGKAFTRSGLPVRNGNAIELTIVCPAGNDKVYKRADLANAQFKAAGITRTPLPTLKIKTDPEGCSSE